MNTLKSNKPVLSLWLCLLALCLLPQRGFSVTYDEFTINRKFTWDYRETTFSVEIEIPLQTYNHYSHKERYYANYSWYAGEHPSFRIMGDIAAGMKEVADEQGFDEKQTLEFLIAFVQSMEYQKDQVAEYPKFPAETLVDMGGDCEDTSVLLAALLSELGYQTILLSPPGHMAVGVSCASCTGLDLEYEGNHYFYVETTAPGYGIGEIPEMFNNCTMTAIPLTLNADEVALLSDEGPLFHELTEITVYTVGPGDEQLMRQLMSKWINLGNGKFYDSESDKIIVVEMAH